MPNYEGIDHDRMVGPKVFDTFAFGEENKVKLGQVLYALDNLISLPFAELVDNEASFLFQLNEILRLIESNRDKVDPAIINELTFYYTALQALTQKHQDDDIYYAEIKDLQDIAKRILRPFRLTEPEKPVKKPAPEISKPRQSVINRLSTLLSQFRDK